jgi:hypothetical protein
LTDWPEFARADPRLLAAVVTRRSVVDGRSVLDPGRWTAAGWNYRRLGQPALPPEGPAPPIGRPGMASVPVSSDVTTRPGVAARLVG